MFGTLVMALPSKYEGGEVHVTHAGKTKVFAASEFSAFEYPYLAWFSDVSHEVKPITSGRRLVLTYNLIHNTIDSKELNSRSDKGMAKLRAVFSRWKEMQDAPKTLALLLDHQYTEASLCYAGVKGHDQHVGSHLREICEEHGFYLYLANLEKSVFGECDEDDYDYDSYGYGSGYGRSRDFRRQSSWHKIIEVCDTIISLKRVVDLEGVEVGTDMGFDEETFVQPNALKNAEPDDEDYSGFTGNEGVSTTHFYHRTVCSHYPIE